MSELLQRGRMTKKKKKLALGIGIVFLSVF